MNRDQIRHLCACGKECLYDCPDCGHGFKSMMPVLSGHPLNIALTLADFEDEEGRSLKQQLEEKR